jgi:8-oxo-dGTP pyrophosphatase MutT (NUDIX family)
MSWPPAVTVAAVIREGDRYLMVEEEPDGHMAINQPAGHLEPGETLIEAVRREVLEETGRRFTPTGLVGVYQWTLPGSGQSYLRFCFAGEVGPPIPGRALDPDIRATRWMTFGDIAGGALAPRSPMVLRCIEDNLARPPLSLDVLHALV